MGNPPITFTSGEISAYYAARVPDLKEARGRESRGPCPVHGGKDDNFTVNLETGQWFCFSTCSHGGGIFELEMALTDADFKTAKNEVFRLVGRIEPEYRHNGARTNRNSTGMSPSGPTKPSGQAGAWREIARYPYLDRDGVILFEVVRYLKRDGTKTFIPVRPSGVEAVGTVALPAGGIVVGLAAGNYVPDPTTARRYGKPAWKRARANDANAAGGVRLRECPRVPYRLPQVHNAETVYLPEGEQDVHTLEEWAFVASCNPGGSASSHSYVEWVDYFQGKHIVILPDNDRPGRKHATAVATALLSVAASVRIVELPGLAEKGDVTDWRDAGGTLEQFGELTEGVAPMNPVTLSALLTRWGVANEEPHKLVSGPKPAESGSLATRCLSDVEAMPIHWLWPGRIARGKLTIIAGDPGLGKSQITASIAAIVTNAGRWPVDRQQCERGAVLFLSAEDDPADTLRPRLEAAGADLRRVHFVDGVTLGYAGDGSRTARTFSLRADVQALGAKLAVLGGVAVVVIDPISAYLGDTDSHKNAEVRSLLTPLSELAARHDTAIIGISHLNKAPGMQALMRVTGSLAFVAAARGAYLVTTDPNDKARRLFLPLKNNVGPDATGLAFRIEGATVESPAGPLETSRVSWESEPVLMSADEAMQTGRASGGTSALETAKDFLGEVLADGSMTAEGIFDRAQAEGIASKTLQRASKALGVQKTKLAMAGGWSWSLSPKVAKSAEDGHVSRVATFEEVGHLRKTDDRKEPLEKRNRIDICAQCGRNEWQWDNAAWVCAGCGTPPRKVEPDSGLSGVDCGATDERPMSRVETSE